MSFDYRSKDIDALLASIEHTISSVRASYGTSDADINALISIAEVVKKHAPSAKNGVVSGTAIMQDLIRQEKENDSKSTEHSDVATLQLPSLSSVIFSDRIGGAMRSAPLTRDARRKDSPSRIQKSPKLKTANGKSISLGKCLGQGGEGSVYKIPALPGKVAKVYHTHRISARSRSEIERKICFLARKKDAAYIGETLIAALPEEVLYFSDGSFAGYIMPQFATSAKLFDVQREGHRRRLFPELDYRGLIVIAYNLAEAVNQLHNHGIVIGDMNQNNILVHADGTIGLIDCDSFDVTNLETGEHFPCCVGLTELLAPELQVVGSLRNGTFTKSSDCFSLAIHIFRLLMNNADPFCFSMTSDTQMLSLSIVESENSIVNGECVYFKDIPGKQIPKWSPPISVIPNDLQSLFKRTFDYTATTAFSKVGQRPTAAEWMSALQNFYQLPLTQCKKDEFHWYLPHLPACPFCQNNDDDNGTPTAITIQI